MPAIYHPTHDIDGVRLSGTPIDVISDKHGLATGRRAPRALFLAIPHAGQQCFQLQRMSVNVPNDVVAHAVCSTLCGLSVSQRRSTVGNRLLCLELDYEGPTRPSSRHRQVHSEIWSN